MSDAQVLTSHEAILHALAANVKEGEKAFAKKAKNETRDNYLKRLVGASMELPDDVFSALPQPAIQWLNMTANDFNEKKDEPVVIRHLDGYDKDEPEAGGNESKSGGDESKSEATGGASAATADKPKTAAKAAPAEPKGPGMVRVVREAVLHNPSITNDEVMALVVAAGVKEPKMTSVSFTRLDSLSFLRVMRDLNMLPESLVLPAGRGEK